MARRKQEGRHLPRVLCEKCEGTGKVRELRPRGAKLLELTVNCPACKGQGTVSVRKAGK